MQIGVRPTVVKACSWSSIDAKVQRHREQNGLDTRVVCAVNAEFSMLDRQSIIPEHYISTNLMY